MISQARLSEMAGPIAADIDDALRRLDFGKATEATLALLEPSTKDWLEAYVRGINTAIERSPQVPPEFGFLGLKREPFTVEDLLTFGRLAGTDVNWLTLISLLSERGTAQFPEILDHANLVSRKSTTSFSSANKEEGTFLHGDSQGSQPTGKHAPDDSHLLRKQISQILLSSSRSGSNTVAIGADRSADGHAMIASDPHLGQALPNFWTVVGMKSPNYHAVGLMIPGLPFLGLGRNENIAWGGTNMRAASSELIDATNLPITETRTETVGIRFWPDREIEVRETEFGPILSDSEVFPAAPGETIALRWMGHQPSDEITAFLNANRGQSVDEFLSAFGGYSVSGQNMIAVDDSGSIGMVLAVALPQRSYDELADIVLDPDDVRDDWDVILDSDELPQIKDPSSGFLASANNLPVEMVPPIGYLFNESERIDRLIELLETREKWTVSDLMSLQQDVFSPASFKLARFLVDWNSTDADSPIMQAIDSWDGNYDVNSEGAAAFELWLASLLEQFPSDKFGSSYFSDWRYVATGFFDDLAGLSDREKEELITVSLAEAEARFDEYPTWGDLHFIEAGHILKALPVVGDRFVYQRFPVPGSRETIYKTAHSVITEPHTSRYGSQSRHISSMADADDNWFVLFGGQDGWIGSAHFDDQIRLWQEGKYMKVPLRIKTVETQFRRKIVLEPLQ